MKKLTVLIPLILAATLAIAIPVEAMQDTAMRGATQHARFGPVRLLLFGVILIVVLWIRRDQLFPRARTV